MEKHLVIWKKVRCKTLNGSEVYLGIPESVDFRYRGTLLTQILTMPKQKGVLFDDAIRMLADAHLEAFTEGRVGRTYGECHWLTKNFVSWIAEQGFHIELTGDEFLPYSSVQIF